MLQVTDREWKEFFFEDVLSIENGVRLTKANMQEGSIPFVGASDRGNGITAFTQTTNDSYDKNVLGVNYNGSVGFSFYHPYGAVFSDDVKRVRWQESQHNNRYSLLFLSTVIYQQKEKYAYGYKFNTQRMLRQKIYLPVDSSGAPDWEFMEAYMREKEQELLKPLVEKLHKRLSKKDVGRKKP